MQFTIDSAVPLISAAALSATRVEKRGESTTTKIPQKIRKATNILSYLIVKTSDDIRQHPKDNSKANRAISSVPYF